MPRPLKAKSKMIDKTPGLIERAVASVVGCLLGGAAGLDCSRKQREGQREAEAKKRYLAAFEKGFKKERDFKESLKDGEMKEREDILFKNFPIGSTIEFVGITLMVTGHIPYFPSKGKYQLTIYPELICHYSDKSGVILKHNLSLSTIEGLFLGRMENEHN